LSVHSVTQFLASHLIISNFYDQDLARVRVRVRIVGRVRIRVMIMIRIRVKLSVNIRVRIRPIRVVVNLWQ